MNTDSCLSVFIRVHPWPILSDKTYTMPKYSILQAELPGHGLVNLGVLLQDPQSDALRVRLRRDLDQLVEPEELELFRTLSDDLAKKANELGAEKLFAYLE